MLSRCSLRDRSQLLDAQLYWAPHLERFRNTDRLISGDRPLAQVGVKGRFKTGVDSRAQRIRKALGAEKIMGTNLNG